MLFYFFCNLQLLKVQHDSSSYEIMVENSNTRHRERTVYPDIPQNRYNVLQQMNVWNSSFHRYFTSVIFKNCLKVKGG